MKKRTFQKAAVAVGGAVALLYTALLVMNMRQDLPMETKDLDTKRHTTIAIFGATGTIGDGLLKAALTDPDVTMIHVVTRRPSPRIEEGVASGKVEMILHKNYLDYSAILDRLTDVDAVYWAIGLSAVGLDEETYREIHVDYPSRFVAEWLGISDKEQISFHYVSGSGANAKSRMMWAREKARAETELTKLGEDSNLRVISYRPAFITPTEAELNFGHKLMHAILAPIKFAVRAESIGHAMLEVSVRGRQYQNGAILENKKIVGLSEAHRERTQL